MHDCAICDRKFHRGISLTLIEHRPGKEDKKITYSFCPQDQAVAAEFFRAEVMKRTGKQ